MVTRVVASVLLLSSVGAGFMFNATCSTGSEPKLSVNKSADGVEGRYLVQYCSPVDADISGWEFRMLVLNKTSEQCHYWNRHNPTHSSFTVLVHSQNCTHMCFTQHLDLMYTACYEISNQLIKGNIRLTHDVDYYYVLNNISGPEFYKETSHVVKDFDHESTVTFNWYPGRIPITEYRLELCSNRTHSEGCTEVSENCSRAGVAGLHCEFALLPYDCYKLHLTHDAPWNNGLLAQYVRHVDASFCHQPEIPPKATAPTSMWWMAGAGAAAALAAGALLALLLWHTRLARDLRQRVQDQWRASRMSETDTESGAKAARGDAESARILLLYARDCPAATRALHALRALLELAAPGQVHDLYSASVTSAAAAAPSTWTRAALHAPGVRVVLLQTPALRYLHDTPLADAAAPQDELKLAAPLLPRRVMYGAPHPGDALLQYALRLLGETHALHAAPYHKYYIATLSALPAEMFGSVVPYRRYELPAAAELLARELAPAPLDAERLRAPLADLHHAASEFEAFVRAHPDYLTRELVFLP